MSGCMDGMTIVMMCLFLGGIWGGFVCALVIAVRKEEKKCMSGRRTKNGGQDL